MKLCRFAWLPALFVAGCTVGPDYHRPAMDVPRVYTEAAPWKLADPHDALPKPEWWKVFGDPVLDDLEQRAAQASPTLRAALARFDAALALANVSRAALLPNLSINGTGNREHYSANRSTAPGAPRVPYTANTFDLPLQLSYELDLFGRARRALESARAAAQAQGDLYQNVLLTLQSAVAQNYFTLRSLRLQEVQYEQNVALLQDALDLVRKLRAGGVNSDVDVYEAEVQLETVRNSEAAVSQNLADQIHALAVLVGQTPENFAIYIKPLDLEPPPVPVGLPSELLERRPDVAAAERTLASVNAQVGAAKAAFFPSISLTGFAGLNSADLSKLLQWSSREWGLGTMLDVPIFRGGLLRANYEIARANYDEALANYREQVLVAFQEVESGLSDLRFLGQQVGGIDRAVQGSQRLLDLATTRYRSGIVSYLEVIDAQRSLLQNQLLATQVRAQRLVATALLIKAVGGGW